MGTCLAESGPFIVPAICILEVLNRVLQQKGDDAALQVVAIMHQGQIVSLSEALPLWRRSAG